MAEHAKLSPSAADRWINCPGSVKMSEKFPGTASPAAAEGTLAHALAATLIGDPAADVSAIKTKVDQFYAEHKDLNETFAHMRDAIQTYVDYVRAEYQAAKSTDRAAVLLVEQRVDFSNVVPEGFGTSDAVIVANEALTVIDLKYGKGVPVSAVGNPQLRLYALGAVSAFDMAYDIRSVKTVIYQPRLDSISEETINVADLKAWAEKTVKPAVRAALSDNPPYCPGEWCSSRFCPGAGACKARAEYVLALERHAGTDPSLLTDAELADALARAETLQKWARALQEYALGEISTGHPIPGWKVVEGRSIRKYADEDKVAVAAMGAGYDRAMLYKSTLIGITEMERLMGKKRFNEVLGGLVTKPTGAPKLVPETDKRPSFNSARADFDD